VSPTFEYECKECGQVVGELVRSFRVEDKMSECLDCGGELRQRFFPPALFMGKMPMSGHRKWKFPGGGPEKP